MLLDGRSSTDRVACAPPEAGLWFSSAGSLPCDPTLPVKVTVPEPARSAVVLVSETLLMMVTLVVLRMIMLSWSPVRSQPPWMASWRSSSRQPTRPHSTCRTRSAPRTRPCCGCRRRPRPPIARGFSGIVGFEVDPMEAHVGDVAAADRHLAGDRCDAVARGTLDVRVVDHDSCRRRVLAGRYPAKMPSPRVLRVVGLLIVMLEPPSTWMPCSHSVLTPRRSQYRRSSGH